MALLYLHVCDEKASNKLIQTSEGAHEIITKEWIFRALVGKQAIFITVIIIIITIVTGVCSLHCVRANYCSLNVIHDPNKYRRHNYYQ